MSALKFELDTTSGTWLDRHHRAQEELRHIVTNLQYMSTSFFNVGNPIIGTKLERLADTLEKVAEMERTAVSETLSESCASAQQGSINVLQAVLAGAQLERQSKAEKKV